MSQFIEVPHPNGQPYLINLEHVVGVARKLSETGAVENAVCVVETAAGKQWEVNQPYEWMRSMIEEVIR